MNGLLFSAPVFLWGLAALGVPVVIHLLLKRRLPRLPVSSLILFTTPSQKARRRFPRNWFLLLMRLLLFALLVLAFARPFQPASPEDPRNPPRPRHRTVVVVDTGASLRMAGETGPAWAGVTGRLERLVQEMEDGDRMAVVAAASQPVLITGWEQKSAVSEKLGNLRPTDTDADLSEAAKLANGLFKSAPAGEQRRLVILTDGQKTSLGLLASLAVPSEVDLKVITVPQSTGANVSVSASSIRGDPPVAVSARVQNHSGVALRGWPITARCDGEDLGTRRVDLAPGGTVVVEFPLKKPREGWHTVEVMSDQADVLAEDNTARTVFQTRKRARVLCVEPDPQRDRWRDRSYFLQRALASAEDEEGLASRYVLENVPVLALAGKLRSSPFDIVVMPAAETLPDSGRQALQAYVEQGGKLVLFADPETEAEDFARLYGGISPFNVMRRLTLPADGPEYRRLVPVDASHPVFALFTRPGSGDLGLVEFRGRYEVKAVEGATVLACFDDGVPALAFADRGKGRVYFANFSGNTAWTDWPKRKTFLPWLHSLVDHASGQGNGRVAGPSAHVGQTIPAESASGWFSLEGEPVGDFWKEAGFYQRRTAAGEVEEMVAVDGPERESSQNFLSAADLATLIPRVETPETGLLAGPLPSSQNRGQMEWWPLLLAAGLFLMVLEPLIANRT